MSETISPTAPEQLRHELQEGATRELRLRRPIVVTSLVGMQAWRP